MFGIARTSLCEQARMCLGSLPVTKRSKVTPMRPHHRLPHAAAAILAISSLGTRFTTVPWAMVTTILLALPPANATPICVWLDDVGRTQYASVVPEEYKAVARCTDSLQYELSSEQQRAAEHAQAAREGIVRAHLEAAKLAASSPLISPHVVVTAPQVVIKRPAELVTEATDCTTWWRLYDESAACIGPFRTTRGAIKVEAFDVCNVVPSPEPKCGLRSN